jgi:hypothetical protein
MNAGPPVIYDEQGFPRPSGKFHACHALLKERHRAEIRRNKVRIRKWFIKKHGYLWGKSLYFLFSDIGHAEKFYKEHLKKCRK